MIPAMDDTRRRGPRERPWTAENDATLLSLREAGLTMSVAGERLNRSAHACWSRVARLTREEPTTAPARDCLGERIEAYLARIAKLNGYRPGDLKRQCYGWTVR